MIAGVAAQEDEADLAVLGLLLALVGDGKTEDACVKIPHSREICDEHPHVAERERWSHI